MHRVKQTYFNKMVIGAIGQILGFDFLKFQIINRAFQNIWNISPSCKCCAREQLAFMFKDGLKPPTSKGRNVDIVGHQTWSHQLFGSFNDD